MATVMVSGCIGEDDTPANDKFTKTVAFQGMTFYLPDGYTLNEAKSESTVINEVYTDGTNVI
ncbi:MAG: hypothetical protein LBF15_00745, partial [Candidatus Peribacteria bacterium]|nr:hypothetical protein [Candidatus Peribacteria bacterium]